MGKKEIVAFIGLGIITGLFGSTFLSYINEQKCIRGAISASVDGYPTSTAEWCIKTF